MKLKKKNVFVIGMNDFNRKKLLAILYFGGESTEDLQNKFELAKDILDYQIEDYNAS